MINRRQFIVGAGTLLALPCALKAQQNKIPRIGVLVTADLERTQEQFRKALRDFGYVEGQNALVEYRAVPAGQIDRLGDLAAELVRLKVDVIVAQYTPSVQAAKRATTAIPIVMAPAGDPVGTGLIASLARPGGNITGIAGTTGPEFIGKLVQFMKETVPSLSRMAILVDTTDPFAKPFLEGLQDAARSLALRVQVVVVRRAEEFEGAFAAMTKERAGAVVVHPILATKQTADLARQYRLPSFSITPAFIAVGGLMSYSVSAADVMRGAVSYVDRILKGAAAGSLPVEHPTKFELVVNRSTAKALNLVIPSSILVQAHHVID